MLEQLQSARPSPAPEPAGPPADEVSYLRGQVRVLATRAEQLRAFSALLCHATTLDQMVEVTVSYATAALKASAGGAWLLSADARTAVLYHAVGHDATEQRRLALLRLDAAEPHPVVTVLRSGRALWDPVDPETGAPADSHAPRSAICFPLVVGDRCIGAVALRYDHGCSLDAADRRFATTLAAAWAQAIGRASLQDAAAPANAGFERTRERLRALRVATEALAAAGTTEEALAAVVGAGCRALRANAVGVWRVHVGGGARLDLLDARGPGAAALEQYAHIALAPGQADWPLVACALQAKAIWAHATGSAPAGACLPVLFQDRCLAVLVFVVSEGEEIDRADRDFLAVLVNLCAQALLLAAQGRNAHRPV